MIWDIEEIKKYSWVIRYCCFSNNFIFVFERDYKKSSKCNIRFFQKVYTKVFYKNLSFHCVDF